MWALGCDSAAGAQDGPLILPPVGEQPLAPVGQGDVVRHQVETQEPAPYRLIRRDRLANCSRLL